MDLNKVKTETPSSVEVRIVSSICTTPVFRNEAVLRRLYEAEKLSARQIGVLTGCGHTTINEALKRYGINRQIRRGGYCPYGFRRSLGKLVPIARQQVILKKICQRLDSGWSANSIATWLNSSKIKSPTGKGRWHGATVRRLTRPVP